MLHAFNFTSINPCPKGADSECCLLNKYLKTLNKGCKDCLNNCEEVKHYWEMKEV